MKIYYCDKCKKKVIEMKKGKIQKHLYLECKHCQDKRYSDMPTGFAELFNKGGIK